MVLNSSHLNNTIWVAFKRYRITIWYKKLSYIEHKREGTTPSTQKWPKTILEELEEKMDSTLPFMPWKVVDYCTIPYTSRQSIIDHFVPNIPLSNVFIVGKYGHIWRFNKSPCRWHPRVKTKVYKNVCKWFMLTNHLAT